MNDHSSFEEALMRTEADAQVTIKAGENLMRHLRKFRLACKAGDLRELHSSIEAAGKAMDTLRQQLANARDGWTFEETDYLASGEYARELVEMGKKMGVDIFERDERLYCYPALIKVSPGDRVAFIDKKRTSRLRPSHLVTNLRELQRKPPSFKAETFLEALHKAYLKAVAMRARQQFSDGPVIPLVDIYDLFTLLPGQSKEYTKQEFARDIYLLHQSGVDTTRGGAKVSFPASSGTRTPSKTLSILTQAGDLRRYYGISFTGETGRA